MSRVVWVVAVLAAFQVCSCKKHYDISDNTQPNSKNPTSYILTSGTSTTASGDTILYTYTYESRYFITNIRREYRRGAVDNVLLDTAYYTFEYTNGLCTKATEKMRDFKGVYTYEYNSDNLLVKRIVQIGDGPIMTYSFYEYDALHNLVAQRDSSSGSGSLIYRHQFAYGNNNNLVLEVDSTLFLQPRLVAKKEWQTFDNKVNYIKTINGLPPFFPFFAGLSPFSQNYVSENNNNLTAESYHFPTAAGQPFAEVNVTSSAIEYNEANLPVRISSAGWTDHLTYEKFR